MIEETVLNRNDFIDSFCKELTEWVTSEKDAIFFAKSKRKRKISCGDIHPTKKSVNWLTKLRFTIKYGYKNATFDNHFISGEENIMNTLWRGAVKRAGDNIPVLLYRKPHVGTYVFIPHELYDQIKMDVISTNMMRVRYFDAPDAYVFKMDEFFNNVTYKKLKKVVAQI